MSEPQRILKNAVVRILKDAQSPHDAMAPLRGVALAALIHAIWHIEGQHKFQSPRDEHSRCCWWAREFYREGSHAVEGGHA